MSRAKMSTIAIKRRAGIVLEVNNGSTNVATVEIDEDGDVRVGCSGLSLDEAKALATAIVQATEEWECLDEDEQ